MHQLGRQAGQSVMDHQEELARKATTRLYVRHPELRDLYPRIGYKKSEQDMGYHFSYLAEALAVEDAGLFLDYVHWAKVLFVGLRLSPEFFKVSLECMLEELKVSLTPEQADLACGMLERAVEQIDHSGGPVTSFLSPELPLNDLATAYLNTLLQGDRNRASQLIMDAVARRVGVKQIYLYVFQPCQQEIGRLWQLNQVSVAKEHFFTAVTQLIMARLYPHICTPVKTGYSLLATSVGNELHEIGMRMVADFFEMDGWNTYYLGANTPTASILQTLEERNFEILAISATLTPHVRQVVDLIQAVRAKPKLAAVKILVGGYPFNISRNLWQQVGADGYAPNAQDAVLAATRLMQVAQ